MRHYQQECLNWVSFLYKCGFGACLADDMGLGKTVQTLSFLAAIHEGLIKTIKPMIKAPFLVVVPPSLNMFGNLK